jgi:hypothetical protein
MVTTESPLHGIIDDDEEGLLGRNACMNVQRCGASALLPSNTPTEGRVDSQILCVFVLLLEGTFVASNILNHPLEIFAP